MGVLSEVLRVAPHLVYWMTSNLVGVGAACGPGVGAERAVGDEMYLRRFERCFWAGCWLYRWLYSVGLRSRVDCALNGCVWSRRTGFIPSMNPVRFGYVPGTDWA